MSVASEITRLQNAKSALATSIENKGVTVPSDATLDDFSALVDAIETGGGGSSYEWERPSSWPDYTKIPLLNVGANELYMTYDCKAAIKGEHPSAISILARVTGGYTVERGYIDDNGFVAVATSSVATNTNFEEELPTNEGDYVVYRITATNDITYFTLSNWKNYVGNRAYSVMYQPCVEAYGKMENATTFSLKTYMLVNFAVVLKSITGMNGFLQNCYSLLNVDTTDWDVSSATNMNNAFSGCRQLRNIDVSGWDTGNVTNMAGTFITCLNLEELDVSGWDMSSVTTTSGMFANCFNLKTIDVSAWVTSAVTNMSNMFSECRTLETLDVSSWDVSSVTNFTSCFYDCYSLENIDVSSWNVSAATTLYRLFYCCYSFTELDVSSWVTSSVTDMRNVFSECNNLESLDVSGWDTSSVTTMAGMFSGCINLKELDISGWDVGSVTTVQGIFTNMYNLGSMDLTNWDFSAMTVTTQMFYGCFMLKEVRLGSTLTVLSVQTFNNAQFIESFVFYSTTPPTMASTNAFSSISTAAKIYVPDDSVDAYKAASNWSTYASYIYPLSEYTG